MLRILFELSKDLTLKPQAAKDFSKSLDMPIEDTHVCLDILHEMGLVQLQRPERPQGYVISESGQRFVSHIKPTIELIRNYSTSQGASVRSIDSRQNRKPPPRETQRHEPTFSSIITWDTYQSEELLSQLNKCLPYSPSAKHAYSILQYASRAVNEDVVTTVPRLVFKNSLPGEENNREILKLLQRNFDLGFIQKRFMPIAICGDLGQSVVLAMPIGKDSDVRKLRVIHRSISIGGMILEKWLVDAGVKPSVFKERLSESEMFEQALSDLWKGERGIGYMFTDKIAAVLMGRFQQFVLTHHPLLWPRKVSTLHISQAQETAIASKDFVENPENTLVINAVQKASSLTRRKIHDDRQHNSLAIMRMINLETSVPQKFARQFQIIADMSRMAPLFSKSEKEGFPVDQK